MADAIPTATIYEAEGVTNFARIVIGSTGLDMQFADLDAITLNVYDASVGNPTPLTVVAGPTDIPVGTGTGPVWDVLQTADPAYTKDDEGYNFKDTFDGFETFLEGGKTYLIEYKFEFTTEPDKFVYVRVETVSVWSQ